MLSFPGPTTMTTRSTPDAASSLTTSSITAVSTIGSSSFGTVRVIGRKRVPRPPAGTTPYLIGFTCGSWLDVIDSEAVEREGAVGHVLEAKQDLLAGVRGQIDLLLYPRRLSPAGCPGEAVAEVLAVGILLRRRGRGKRRPARAAVRRNRDVPIVVVRLDLVPRPERELRARRLRHVDRAREATVETVGAIGPPHRGAGVRIGRHDLAAQRAAELHGREGARQLDVSSRVRMHRARELASERHAILVGRRRSDARDRAARDRKSTRLNSSH